MADTTNCPACGFPNPAGAHSCMSCQSPLPVQARTQTVSDRLRPTSASREAPSHTVTKGTPYSGEPVDPYGGPESPEEIIERIRRVRGEDALRSLEMMAVPSLREAVEQDLSQPPTTAATGTPTASAPLPGTASAYPGGAGTGPAAHFTRTAGTAAADPWVVDHHEARALEVKDPWQQRFGQSHYRGSRATARAATRGGFSVAEVVGALGVVAMLASLAMPWMAVQGETSLDSLRPASLPITLLVTGVSDTYPMAWLSAALVTVVLAVIAVVGLVLPRSQLAATGLSLSGLAAVLVPSAFLLKLALSGELGTEGEIAYVAAPGMYVAIGAALVVLLGAALRGSGRRK